MEYKDKLANELVILTPSKINSQVRANYSMESLRSLRNIDSISKVPHYVAIDSSNLFERLNHFFRNFKSLTLIENNCNLAYCRNPSDKIIESNGSGSTYALSIIVKQAINDGFKYGFIHLDDHVYIEKFSDLVNFSINAFSNDKDLAWLRYSGYPVLYKNKKKLVNIENQINFDGVALVPDREANYTAWKSVLTSETNEGAYWPVAMWFCIYRLDFLDFILDEGLKEGSRHLANVESLFKNTNKFNLLLDKFKGTKFGYINMQFGGLEMHRNKNWHDLIDSENLPVL